MCSPHPHLKNLFSDHLLTSQDSKITSELGAEHIFVVIATHEVEAGESQGQSQPGQVSETWSRC